MVDSLSRTSSFRPAGPALKLSNILMSSGCILGSMVASYRRKNTATSLLSSICAKLVNVSAQQELVSFLGYSLYPDASSRTNGEWYKCLLPLFDILFIEPPIWDKPFWVGKCRFPPVYRVILYSYNSLDPSQ